MLPPPARCNSTIVAAVGFHENSFQFHIGSIKSGVRKLGEKLKSAFQFHIGSIKSNEFFKFRINVNGVSIPHWFN